MLQHPNTFLMKIANIFLINIFMDLLLLLKARHILSVDQKCVFETYFVDGFILDLYIPISISVCIEMYL